MTLDQAVNTVVSRAVALGTPHPDAERRAQQVAARIRISSLGTPSALTPDGRPLALLTGEDPLNALAREIASGEPEGSPDDLAARAAEIRAEVDRQYGGRSSREPGSLLTNL